MLLHQQLLQKRKHRGLTQEELADLTGLTVRTIQRIENGEGNPRPYTLKKVAAALDIEVTNLAAWQQPGETLKDMSRDKEETIHFLQLLCLSCFSYLVVPYIHFLIPMYILRKRNEQDKTAKHFAGRLIKWQIYWMIALNLSLILTLAYNLLGKTWFPHRAAVSYLVPFFFMYFMNVILIIYMYLQAGKMRSVPGVG